MPKARVLPVPVLAWPMRSCPSRAIGSVRAWIGKAWVIPAASRAAQNGSETPKSRNVLSPRAASAAASCEVRLVDHRADLELLGGCRVGLG